MAHIARYIAGFSASSDTLNQSGFPGIAVLIAVKCSTNQRAFDCRFSLLKLLALTWRDRRTSVLTQGTKVQLLKYLHITCAVKRQWTSAGATPARELVGSTR